MNGAGLAGLVSGFQQGYTFVDDMQRKKKDDARKDAEESRTSKEFARKEKGWSKADDYDSERMALIDEYYPAPKKDKPSTTPQAAAGAIPAPQEPAPGAASAAAQAAMAPAPAGAPASAGAPSAGMQQPAPMAQPTAAGPVPIAAAGAAPAPPAAPAKPDPMNNLNKTLDFAMKNAMIDVKHGKLDGQGLIALQKVVDGMRNEKADESISLMHQGRFDEAMQAFNSSGDHAGSTIVSAKDGVFKAGKSDVPTKIVTVQDANGNLRTINTAETMFQRQKIDHVIEQAQKDRQLDETSRHNKSEEGIQATNAQSQRISANASMAHVGIAQQSLNMQKEQFKKQSLSGQVEQIESVTGPLKPEERKALGMQLAGLGKDNQAYAKFIDGVVLEGVKAGTIKAEDSVKVQQRLMQGKMVMDTEASIASDLASSTSNPAEYAAKYQQAIKVTPPARLLEMGFKPPAAMKAGPAAKSASMGVPMAAPDGQSKADALGNTFAERQATLAKNLTAADSDAELQSLQAAQKQARQAGNSIAANNALAKYNELRKSRYGL